MRIAALQSILNVDSAMCVAGALVTIVLLLVHLHSPLVPSLRILRNRSTASAINCFFLCCLFFFLPFMNKFGLFFFVGSVRSIAFVHTFMFWGGPPLRCVISFFGHNSIQTQLPQKNICLLSQVQPLGKFLC